jgi:hypothetical protein
VRASCAPLLVCSSQLFYNRFLAATRRGRRPTRPYNPGTTRKALLSSATLAFARQPGLPPQATIEWAAFTVDAQNLLTLFPAEVVGEHYDRLSKRKRAA